MIKNNIKAMRKLRGLNTSELAARVGTDQSMITRLESGDRKLTLEWIDVLHRALECAPWQLLPDEWQPQSRTIDDAERFFRILAGTNVALKELHKAAPEEEKMRFVMYLYNEGYGQNPFQPANDNEISRAVKLAWRVA